VCSTTAGSSRNEAVSQRSRSEYDASSHHLKGKFLAAQDRSESHEATRAVRRDRCRRRSMWALQAICATPRCPIAARESGPCMRRPRNPPTPHMAIRAGSLPNPRERGIATRCDRDAVSKRSDARAGGGRVAKPSTRMASRSNTDTASPPPPPYRKGQQGKRGSASFLDRDQRSVITGVVLPVDGGVMGRSAVITTVTASAINHCPSPNGPRKEVLLRLITLGCSAGRRIFVRSSQLLHEQTKQKEAKRNLHVSPSDLASACTC